MFEDQVAPALLAGSLAAIAASAAALSPARSVRPLSPRELAAAFGAPKVGLVAWSRLAVPSLTLVDVPVPAFMLALVAPLGATLVATAVLFLTTGVPSLPGTLLTAVLSPASLRPATSLAWVIELRTEVALLCARMSVLP